MAQFNSLGGKLKEISNPATLVVFQIDRTGFFTLNEEDALKLVNSESIEIGKSIYDVFQNHPTIISTFEEILKSGKKATCSFELPDKRLFETTMTPVIHNGIIVVINVVAIDILKQYYFQNGLIESEERYRILVESSPFGILVMHQALITFSNNKFASMFGYNNTSEIVGRPGIEFLAPKVRYDLLKRSLNREKGYSEPKTFESTGLTKSGKEFPMKVHIEKITFMGKPAVLGFYQDITEQKKAEEQNQLMIQKLIKTQKLESLGTLAGGIAHDFNNLLVGIMGFTSLILAQADEKSDIYSYAKKIEKSSLEANELARQMLHYSGKGIFQKEIVSLQEMINDNHNLFRICVSEFNQLSFKLEDNLPLVKVDTIQIQQLILNLVNNACEAINHDHGIITISLSKADVDSHKKFTTLNDDFVPGPYLELRVTDNGSGIDKEIIEKVFDPFFSTKSAGRGLGLAVVQGIVAGHNGLINIESEPSNGTAFEIFLPIEEDLALQSTNPVAIEFNNSTKTVLICDDEEMVVDFSTNIFEQLGFKIIIARDGLESINKFEKYQNEIDLVLLDLTMPKIQGQVVFQLMLSIKPEIKIILSSGFNETEVFTNFTGKNLSGFLQKPYTYQDILNIIDIPINNFKSN